MKAMRLERIAALDEDNPDPLVLREIERPAPAEHDVLIRVRACGVCHTELDEIEGRTPPPELPVVPGHEVIGEIVATGAAVTRLSAGQRVGVGWIHASSGDAGENLDPGFVATGRDVDGGYAEYMIVGEGYAHPVPEVFDDAEAAPLLCAGAVGYRALKHCELDNGDVLGLTGFGGSGHLVLQAARYLYPNSPLYVFARSEAARDFALELGADWSGATEDVPPEPPHAVIDTTPAWKPVLAALAAIRPGGRVVVNAIRKEAGDAKLLAGLNYERQLWKEKTLTSVANVTAADIREFLDLAAAAGIRPDVTTWPLEEANRALHALRAGEVRGAHVLTIG